jgi:ABC-type antimicrobial peptide transport system ATPase subunit
LRERLWDEGIVQPVSKETESAARRVAFTRESEVTTGLTSAKPDGASHLPKMAAAAVTPRGGKRANLRSAL